MRKTVDITDRNGLEDQKDDFIAAATHELKTPVTSIKGYTQILQKKFDRLGDRSTVKQLGKMDAQINKLTNLIGDLLDASKIQSGTLQLKKKQLDIDLLVREVVREAQETTELHTMVIKGGTGKKLRADRDRVSQVLNNLLSNAIKYSHHRTRIVVNLSTDNKIVIVNVRDQGVGIPKEYHERIFERFYRVSRSHAHTFPGLGLGLYISAEIVKRHGGRIWVESQKGKGSNFCFTLPV